MSTDDDSSAYRNVYDMSLTALAFGLNFFH